jgi:tetratricopeptide (TPR) repeat protein
VAQIETNLGELALDQDDPLQAEQFARAALKMRQNLGPKDAPIVASSLIDLGMSRLYQGDAAGAESLFRRALVIRQQRLARDNPAVTIAEVRLGEALVVQGKYSEADQLLGTAVAYVHAPPFPLPSWQVAEANEDYDFCRSTMHKPAAARPKKSAMAGIQTDPRPCLREAAELRLTDLTKRAARYATARQ